MKCHPGQVVHMVETHKGELTILSAIVDYCRTSQDGSTEYHLQNWCGHRSEDELHVTFDGAMSELRKAKQ